MVVDAGPMVQFVLLALLIFSIVSWAIILMKYRVVSRTEKENNQFLDAYMNSSKLSDVLPESKRYPNSTIAEVFRAGYLELGKISRTSKGTPGGELLDAPGIEMRGLDNVERALHRACGTETSKLESLLGSWPRRAAPAPSSACTARVGHHERFRGIGRAVGHLAWWRPGSPRPSSRPHSVCGAIPAVYFTLLFETASAPFP